MIPRIATLLVLFAATLSAPAFSQANRNLTPVAPNELNKFIGRNIQGRYLSNIGIVTNADRQKGTLMVVSRHGQVATIPVSLLGRRGWQLRAPAVSTADIARASYTGKSRVPLQGEVTVSSLE
jgi:hypothetical protein